MLMFIIGLIVGAVFGIFCMCLMFVSKDSDARLEDLENKKYDAESKE